MTCSVNVKRRDGNRHIIPRVGLRPVPVVGQTISFPINSEVVTARVIGVRRHYIRGDTDNAVYAVEAEEL
jgi:hypothetical protein